MPVIDIRGLQLYYEIKGTGPRLLVLLGSGSDLRHSPNIFQTPLCEHFEVLAFDQRGQGRSDAPDVPYTMADYADDAHALVRGVGWDTCHVLGISFGGMVAQELALRHPELVERLILACSSSGGEGGSSYPIHELAGLEKQARVEAMVPLFDVRWGDGYDAVGPRPRGNKRRLKKQLEGLVAQAEDPDKVVGMVRQLEARLGHDTFAGLSQLKVPTLIAGGRFDGIAPPINLWRMHKEIPDSQMTLFAGGHLFFQEDPAAFVRFVDFLLDRENKVSCLLDRAMCVYLSDQFNESKALFGEILAIDATHPEALFFLGESHRIDDDDNDSAALVWNKLGEAHPDTPWGLMAKSQLANHLDGKKPDARALLDQCIERFPDFALAYNYRSDLCFESYEYEQTRLDLEKAIALDPGDVVSFQNRASLRMRLSQYTEVLPDTDEAIRQAPYYIHAYVSRGQVFEKLERWDDAFATYNQILSFAPDVEFALVRRGVFHTKHQRWEEAMSDFEKVLQIDPNDANALAGRGDIYLAQGEYDKAINDYNEAIARDATDVWQYFMKRAYAHQVQGSLDAAISDYCETLYRQYDAVEALVNRGLVYKQQGNYAAALNDFSEAINRKGDDAYAHNNRGVMYAYRNDNALAIIDFMRAIELNAKEPEFFYNCACAREETGDVQGAIADLQQYLELGGRENDDHAAITERINRLKALSKRQAC